MVLHLYGERHRTALERARKRARKRARNRCTIDYHPSVIAQHSERISTH